LQRFASEGGKPNIFSLTFYSNRVDLEQAKAITFNKEIRTRSVTLLGDVFDPAGTLRGGSRPSTKSVLVQLQELNQAKAKLKAHEKKLADINKQIEDSQERLRTYKKLKQEYQIKSHEVDLLQARINQSSHQQFIVKVLSKESSLLSGKRS